MKYAHYDETTRKILGWYDNNINKNIPTPSAEIKDLVYQNAINNNHNKINEDGTTELFDFRTEEEIAAQLRSEKLATFNTAWDNLKIGYSTTLKEAFQVKYGTELGVGYEGTVLYNCATLIAVESTDHLYKCSQDNINLLTEKKSSQYSSSDGAYWYGSLGVYPLDSIELGVVLLKANELVQALADLILGAE